MWYGDSVTLSTSPDIWLHEGFATWSEWIWSEYVGQQVRRSSGSASSTTRPPQDIRLLGRRRPRRPRHAGVPVQRDDLLPRRDDARSAPSEKIGDFDFFRIMRSWAQAEPVRQRHHGAVHRARRADQRRRTSTTSSTSGSTSRTSRPAGEGYDWVVARIPAPPAGIDDHGWTAMRELPSGTITLLFADIEQSTALVQRLGAERYAEVLGALPRADARGGLRARRRRGRHRGRRLLRRLRKRSAGGRGGDVRRRTPWPATARACGWVCTRASRPSSTGQYTGIDVHRAARIAAAGNGGQVLLSAVDARAARSVGGRPRRRSAPAQGSRRARAPLPARPRKVPAAAEPRRDEPARPADAAGGT